MLNVILIGPQGSGKGTQAQMIIREYGLKYIEMGSMIRNRAKGTDKEAEIIDHIANKKGELLPDGIILDMLYDELEQEMEVKGYLFDGFPRTGGQYLALKDLLKKKSLRLDAAIYLQISDKEAIKRLTARRICTLCKKGYSLLLEPERIKCDCGGNLIKRADDEPEAIAKRLVSFHQETKPILAMMKKDGVLKEINGEQTIEEISSDIKIVCSISHKFINY